MDIVQIFLTSVDGGRWGFDQPIFAKIKKHFYISSTAHYRPQYKTNLRDLVPDLIWRVAFDYLAHLILKYFDLLSASSTDTSVCFFVANTCNAESKLLIVYVANTINVISSGNLNVKDYLNNHIVLNVHDNIW